MKIKTNMWILIISLILLYVLNYLALSINWFLFTGISLIVLIGEVVVMNIINKVREKKKGIDQSNSFIFPKEMGSKMKTIDPGIQHEASIISVAFLILGSFVFTIYFVFFAEYSLFMKIFYVFNWLCGVVLMGSMIVTSYQQYVAYQESKEFLNKLGDLKGGTIN